MVNVAFHIRCQDDKTVVIFNSLKQIRDFLVAISIVCIFYTCPFAK